MVTCSILLSTQLTLCTGNNNKVLFFCTLCSLAGTLNSCTIYFVSDSVSCDKTPSSVGRFVKDNMKLSVLFFFLFLKTFSTSNTYHCSGLIQSVRACILKTVLLQGKHANGLESSEKWIMNKITDAGWILSAICISICLWDYFSIMQAHHAHMHLLSFSSKSLIKPLKRLTLKKTHTIQLCLNSWQITQVLNLHIPLCQNITHSICHISSITGDPKKTTNYHPMSS